ncbi:MAG TPA: hypothetical protein VMX17_13400 [Candidatus Glassbacteria bacterium]|nr:hypothetical protein [Candidatus Glassbacteria bacterium]
MKKTAFKLPSDEDIVEVEFLGQKIEIKTVIELKEQLSMIANYIINYFSSNKDESFGRYNFFEADLLLRLELVDALTSIDIEDKFDINKADALGIIKLLKKHVKNYDSFFYRLNKTISIIEDEKESDLSIGKTIDGLSEKIENIFNKIMVMSENFSVEDVENVKKGVKDILEMVDESSVSKYLKEGSE